MQITHTLGCRGHAITLCIRLLLLLITKVRQGEAKLRDNNNKKKNSLFFFINVFNHYPLLHHHHLNCFLLLSHWLERKKEKPHNTKRYTHTHDDKRSDIYNTYTRTHTHKSYVTDSLQRGENKKWKGLLLLQFQRLPSAAGRGFFSSIFNKEFQKLKNDGEKSASLVVSKINFLFLFFFKEKLNKGED